MTIVWSLLALILGLTAGAFGMRWHVERSREIAAQEDSRDTQIRELLAALRIARADLGKARKQTEEGALSADQAAQHITELEQSLGKADREHDMTRKRLEAEISEKATLQEEITRWRRDCEALKIRVQELELELHARGTADLLDPTLQVS